MHEGFVNFNAGTLGHSMIEGRISAGVVVGEGSDVGGGASIMGTLSGGGKEVISIGKGCLVGANAGLGISLGDESVVEAGCYVTAGTKVTLPDGASRQGSRPLRCGGAAVPPQQRHRCHRSRAPLRQLGRPQRRAAQQLMPGATRTGTPRRRPPVAPRVRVRRRRLVAAIAIGAVAVIVSGVLWWRGSLDSLINPERCVATVDGRTVDARSRPGRECRDDRLCRAVARSAGARRDDRARHGLPGVRPAQHRARRP